MLTIRREQLQAFAQYMRASYEERLTKRMASEFPAEAEKLGDQAIDFIRQGIDKAGGYRIDTEKAVSRYVELTFKFGADFESQEKMKWTSAILRDEEISGDAKMDLIYQQLPLHAPETE